MYHLWKRNVNTIMKSSMIMLLFLHLCKEDVDLVEFKRSFCTLYLPARQVRVTVGDSGLCCHVYVTFFECSKNWNSLKHSPAAGLRFCACSCFPAPLSPFRLQHIHLRASPTIRTELVWTCHLEMKDSTLISKTVRPCYGLTSFACVAVFLRVSHCLVRITLTEWMVKL